MTRSSSICWRATGSWSASWRDSRLSNSASLSWRLFKIRSTCTSMGICSVRFIGCSTVSPGRGWGVAITGGTNTVNLGRFGPIGARHMGQDSERTFMTHSVWYMWPQVVMWLPGPGHVTSSKQMLHVTVTGLSPSFERPALGFGLCLAHRPPRADLQPTPHAWPRLGPWSITWLHLASNLVGIINYSLNGICYDIQLKGSFKGLAFIFEYNIYRLHHYKVYPFFCMQKRRANPHK